MDKRQFGKVTLIPGEKNGRYPFCHSLYIDDEKKVIIDPSSDQKQLSSLKEGKGVDVIINSHYHEDHFTYNYLFPEADLYVPRADAPCFKSLDKLLEFYGSMGEGFEEIWRKLLVESFHYQERTPTLEFTDGDSFSFGQTTLEVIHTPGHTPGHSCFFFPELELLFLADIDLTRFGPWYGDAASDLEQTIESIKKIRDFPARIFISAHEKAIFEGDISREADNYLRVIERREQDLLDFLGKPRTLEEIVKKRFVYQSAKVESSFADFGERGMMSKHLERLLNSGKIIYEQDRYWGKSGISQP
ncbi:MAG: MBL fold metallo-hydrolase [Deltaproteobacteria bacterium]|nr:MAG: MBL fold metallo-hydrolase [Deltaproteobacteria bacterium]